MRYEDFGQCEGLAEKLCQSLYNKAGDTFTCFGVYRPDSDISTWDERWQRLLEENPEHYEIGFYHCWVEHKEKIYDPASKQFGGPDLEVVDINDKRYQKLGIREGGKLIYHSKEFVIKFDFSKLLLLV